MMRSCVIAIAAIFCVATLIVRAEAQAAPPPRDLGEWWGVFRDPVLDELVARGNRDNTSIEEAAARLAHANATLKAAQANLYPQVGATAAATNQSGQLVNAAGGIGSLYNMGANFSFELDLFGRLAKARNSADLDAKAGEALLASARLLTQAQIAEVYFQIRGLDAEREIQKTTIRDYQEADNILANLRMSGLVTDIAVARTRAEYRTYRSEALTLDLRRAELEHILAFLSGQSADQFRLQETSIRSTLPDIPAGIPSDLLRRRPDVVAASLAEKSARLKVDVAKLAWVPTFSLTGSGGLVSSDLATLFNPASASFGLGSFLASILFDGGRREAGIMAAQADDQLASAQYRTQVLAAFRDVKDQLSAVQSLADQAMEQQEIVRQDETATQLTESRFRDGLTNRLEVLAARRLESDDRRAEERVRAQRFGAITGFIRSLGGSWTQNSSALASHITLTNGLARTTD